MSSAKWPAWDIRREIVQLADVRFQREDRVAAVELGVAVVAHHQDREAKVLHEVRIVAWDDVPVTAIPISAPSRGCTRMRSEIS
jgi:hypothetical protein